MQRVDEVHETRREQLLGFERHHQPVGLVDSVDHILHDGVACGHGSFLGVSGDVVERLYLAAHEDGLCQCHGRAEHVVGIETERLFRNHSHLGWNVSATVGILYRIAERIGEYVPFERSGARIERFGREHGILGQK